MEPILSKKEIINTNQFVWMLFSIITSFTTLQIPGLLIFHAGGDAWISALLGWLLDVLLAIVYARMGLRFPGQNFVQYSMTILGKFWGKIVGIMFPTFFLIVSSLLMRSITILVGNTILPQAPIELILIIGYIFIAYAVKKGIEVIGRSCEVLGPIYLLSFIVLFALVFPKIDLNKLRPLFANGLYPSLSGSIFILSFISICIIMGMYIPICNHIENGFIAKFIAVSLGVFVICSIVILSIAAFGTSQAGNIVNPGLVLTQIVHIENVLDRADAIWFIVAIEAGLMTSANLIWASSLGISQIIGLSTYKPLVYPIALISGILSIVSFDNYTEMINFAFYAYPFISVFVGTGLEVFLFIMALVLKKRTDIAK